MHVIQRPGELPSQGRKVCLAIGVFDGVHLGHQQIIRQTIADARQHDGVALVVTFDRHPNAIVAPQRVPPLIYTHGQKLRTIAALGADALLVLQFDRGFSEQSGESFVRWLAAELGRIQSICVGADFVFGCKRSGNVPLLQRLGEELRFTVHGVSALALDGKIVSSTRIREAIRGGNLDAASQMLGRPYALAGPVVRGDRLGHKLGFPTANLATEGLLLPPHGVYAAQVTLDGQVYRAVLNIGLRPTLQNPTPATRVEVHLLNFQGDLYGREMEVTFAGRIRDEMKFASLEELKLQIARDIATAHERF